MEDQLVRQVLDALGKSGERERLKALLAKKLEGHGWFNLVKTEIDKELQGRNMESFNPQEIVSIIYPKAVQSIPNDVRGELQEEVRKFLDIHIKIA